MIIEHWSKKGAAYKVTPRKAVVEELDKEKIMQAARELFVTKGYRSVSMRGIAGRLGYSHGALYYHFKDKADLFSAMVMADFDRLNDRLDEAMAEHTDHPAATLERIFMAYIRFGLDHKPHYEIMFMLEQSELNDAARRAQMVSYDRFAAAVLRLLRDSGKPGGVPIAVPWSLFLSLHGFVAYYLHTEQTYDQLLGLAEQYVGLMVRGLG
ncbi:TetR/AcrR family transcriptional regulator [Paenibacillus hemerocallicola]|uniref:TetR/AcrR family transcriptional regulator n=1 Tax=Paenibacillus hemerocallicola TaxID=1172614 RepID=A0A5C4T139_9BACL|nr:TetR/AcrR family transcriptional regulator [Paenibacillus hemerocallicola]